MIGYPSDSNAPDTHQIANGKHLVKVIACLQVRYIALQKKHRDGAVNYPALIKALFNYDPEWWKTCKMTANGHLESNDPTVEQILNPVNTFITAPNLEVTLSL